MFLLKMQGGETTPTNSYDCALNITVVVMTDQY